MRKLAIVLLLVAAACFRGEFLDGTTCRNDSECAPRYVCVIDDGDVGRCGDPESPDETGESTGDETTTG